MAYKRKRVYAGPISFKRRRTGVRKARLFRSRRFGNRNGFLSGQTSRGSGFGFRRRRFRPSALKRRLWNDTLYTTHYRSLLDHDYSIATTNAYSLANGFLFKAIQDPFWQAVGGAAPANQGGAVPDFRDDITLRGGLIRAALCNDSAQGYTIRARIFLMKSNKYPNNNIFTGPALLNIGTMFDPSVFPGFREFGKVIAFRETFLLPQSAPFEFTHRLGVQKVDQDDWVTNYGSAYYWMVIVSNCNNPSILPVAAQNVRFVWSHNLTFSADAID